MVYKAQTRVDFKAHTATYMCINMKHCIKTTFDINVRKTLCESAKSENSSYKIFIICTLLAILMYEILVIYLDELKSNNN